MEKAVGGLIQTTKELLVGEYSDGKSVEFWDFDLNKPEAIYNKAWTPEWIYEWNKDWRTLSEEDKKKYYQYKLKNRYEDLKIQSTGFDDIYIKLKQKISFVQEGVLKLISSRNFDKHIFVMYFFHFFHFFKYFLI